MWSFDEASSQAMIAGFAPFTAEPFAMSAWVWITDDSGQHAAVFVGDTGSSNNYYQIGFNGTTAYLQARDSTGSSTPSGSSALITGYWHHLLAVGRTSGTIYELYLDGVSVGTSSTDRSPTSIDSISIGVSADSSPGAYWNAGYIGPVAVWNAALMPLDAARLRQGRNPLEIAWARKNLKFYLDGISPLRFDRVSGKHLVPFATNLPPWLASNPPPPFIHRYGANSDIALDDFIAGQHRRRLFFIPSGGAALVKVVSETEAISEGVESHRAMSRIVNETEAIPESVIRARTLARIIDEIESISEGVIGGLSMVRIVDETVAITDDEIAAIATAIIKVIDETIAVPETTGRISGLVRIIDESVSVGESTLRAMALVRVVDETEAVAETAAISRSLVRIVDETISIAESKLQTGGAIGSQAVASVVEIAEGIVYVVTTYATSSGALEQLADDLFKRNVIDRDDLDSESLANDLFGRQDL